MFAAESGGLIFCSDSSDEKAVYASFREKYDAELRKVSDEAMVLFKVTVDDGSKVKVVVYAGGACAQAICPNARKRPFTHTLNVFPPAPPLADTLLMPASPVHISPSRPRRLMLPQTNSACEVPLCWPHRC